MDRVASMAVIGIVGVLIELALGGVKTEIGYNPLIRSIPLAVPYQLEVP